MSEATLVASILPESGTPYFVMMIVGFVIGAWGHGMKSRLVTAIGIALIFLATLLLPIALVITGEEPRAPKGGFPSEGPE